MSDEGPYTDIHFVEKDIGWIVGVDGKIFKTTDAGVTWTMQTGNTSETLRSVFFFNETTGLISGDNGTVISTKNGGETWVPQESGTLSDLMAIHFGSSESGWIVGGNGTILKSLDSGYTWTVLEASLPTPFAAAFLTDVQFMNEMKGWITGYASSGMIAKTIDGGDYWEVFTDEVVPGAPVPTPFYSLHFISNDTGYISGFSNTVYKTSDGGSSWKLAGPGGGHGYNGLSAIYFLTPYLGYAAGGDLEEGYIYGTTDGGNNWKRQKTISGTNISSIHFIDPGIGYAITMNGTILRTTNGGRAP